jgi:cell wall assembly regulator SMI1
MPYWRCATGWTVVGVALCAAISRPEAVPPRRERSPDDGPRGRTLLQTAACTDEKRGRVAAAWRRIEAALAKIDPEFVERLGKPVAEAEIAALEASLGIPLPGDLRASLAHHWPKPDCRWPFDSHYPRAVAKWRGLDTDFALVSFGECAPAETDIATFTPELISIHNADRTAFLGVCARTARVWTYGLGGGLDWRAGSWAELLETTANRLERGEWSRNQDGGLEMPEWLNHFDWGKKTGRGSP